MFDSFPRMGGHQWGLPALMGNRFRYRGIPQYGGISRQPLQATDLDDQYMQMWENVHTFRLLSTYGVHYATGVDAYDPFSCQAFSGGGMAEEVFGKGYEDCEAEQWHPHPIQATSGDIPR